MNDETIYFEKALIFSAPSVFSVVKLIGVKFQPIPFEGKGSL